MSNFSYKRLRRRGLAASIFPLLIGLLLVACDRSPPDLSVRLTGSTMGTNYELKLVPAPGQTIPTDLQTRIEALLAGINRQMSTYDPNSELSRFNQNPSTDWVSTSPELAQVVAEGLRISALSGGVFDITVGPLVNLWGFGPDPHHDEIPSETAIAQARERVGAGRLHVRAEPPALKKDRPNLYLDLSSLAKGYGVDRMAALIDSIPIENYLVSISGEIRVRGHNGRGEPWTIAVEKPVAGQRAVERLIRLDNRAVSTSGDYRNFFERNGRRYSHIINPRTGWPILQELASVTVISDRSMVADATATALMAAGPQLGLQLASEHHLAALFILIKADGSFQEQFTPELESHLLPEQP